MWWVVCDVTPGTGYCGRRPDGGVGGRTRHDTAGAPTGGVVWLRCAGLALLQTENDQGGGGGGEREIRPGNTRKRKLSPIWCSLLAIKIATVPETHWKISIVCFMSRCGGMLGELHAGTSRVHSCSGVHISVFPSLKTGHVL